MKVLLYIPPNGQTREIEVHEIDAEDEAWFIERKALLSMEEIGGTFACYADVGLRTEDGELDEAIEISGTRSCRETLHALRLQCESLLSTNQEHHK